MSSALIRAIIADNSGARRGLTGQGEPGLYTLLAGTSTELNSDGLTLAGGSGQVSAVSRVARSINDTRLAAVASGRSPSSPSIEIGGPIGRPAPRPTE